MRNLKRALSLALASVMLVGMMVVGTSAAYNDVDTADNIEAIEVLKAVGIMVGDENGNFNPDALVTRQEMAVVMSNLMDYRVASYKGTCPFGDVADWAEPYVAACYTNGITSGMGANYYGATEYVTTAQAALMLQKALGYFQYASDFEGDWQLATVKQANKIDLFDDVASGVKEAMTRNDLAQLVLNTLKSGMVEADDDTIKVTTNDATVEAGSVDYNYITSDKDYAEAIDDLAAWGAAAGSTSGPIVELGEKLYDGNLKCDPATDDFQRPATAWTYKSEDIGTYSDEADASWTTKVTEKALVQAAGTAAYNNYKWSVYRNGDKVFEDVAGDGVLAYGKNSGERWQNCDNGVLTEMYVDNDEDAPTVTVVIIDQFVAEVTKVVDNGDDYTVTVSYKSGKTSGFEKEFDTETKFEKEDIVVVTVGSNEIQSMAIATTVEGNVDAISENSNIVVEGTKYNYNRAYTGGGSNRIGAGLIDLDDGSHVNPALDNDVVLYLDIYGCAVAVEGSEDSVDDYLIVTDYDVAYGDYSVKVVFADGTKAKIDIDEIDDKDSDDEGFEAPTTKGVIYKFKKSGAEYDLETVDNQVPLADAEIKKGTASVEGETTNNSTVYVDVDAGKAYIGYKNIASKTGVTGAMLLDEDDDIVRVVFYDAEGNGAAEDNDFVIVASTTTTTKYIDDEQVWEYTGYVMGEKKTITATDKVFPSKGLYLITEYDNNNDEWVADVYKSQPVVDVLDNDIFATYYATYAKQGVLAVNDKGSNLTDGEQTEFSYDDETLFIVVELKNSTEAKPLGSDVDTVSIGSIADVETDAEGRTAVYVLTVEDDTDATPYAEMVMIVIPADEYVAED